MRSHQSPSVFFGAEVLEDRRHLSAVLKSGVLTVIATVNNDSITVAVDTKDSTKIDVTLNGKTSHFTRTAVKSITINALAGNDKITISDKPSILKQKTTILAGDGSDTVTGGSEKDSIDGGNGNDILKGGGGNDTITAGDGLDFVQGGLGNDSILGEAGDDLLYGDAGNDTLRGGDGNDTLGGDDEDILYFLSDAQNNTLPVDVAGNDDLEGDAGNDWLLGGIGSLGFVDSPGKDTMNGGEGLDIIDNRGSPAVTDKSAEDFDPTADRQPESVVTHTHAILTIKVKGKEVFIPADIGIFGQNLLIFLHTHDASGTIHFESARPNDTYQLGQFFQVWGVSFDARHLGRYVASSKLPITMQVEHTGETQFTPNTQFDHYVPQDGDQIVINIG